LNEKEDKELTQNFETLTHTNGNDLHILQPFFINSSASAYNSKILETASNISPEKYSLSESSESDGSFEHNNNGKKTKPNETSTPKTNKKKRNVKKAYIENAQERASVKYLRLKGLKKKIDLFDTLTASQSAFISLSNKNKFSFYTAEGSRFEAIVPAIATLVERKPDSRSSYAYCDLKDEGKHIHETSERILNSRPGDKIIFARRMTSSKSIDFAKNVSSDEVDSINNKTIHKYKHIKRKEYIDPAKLKTNKEKSSHQASKNKKNLKN
jgi:hypothetical protein